MATFRSNRDPQRDLFKKYLWDFDLALTARFLGDSYQAVSLQNSNILLDVLEVALDHLRKLIKRARMTSSNRSHKRKPFARQEVSGGLDACEADFIT